MSQFLELSSLVTHEGQKRKSCKFGEESPIDHDIDAESGNL